jgi:hypothetical protein
MLLLFHKSEYLLSAKGNSAQARFNKTMHNAKYLRSTFSVPSLNETLIGWYTYFTSENNNQSHDP